MTSELRFNVVCLGCRQVWTPEVHSTLWWRAKKWSDQGKLDALHVTVEDCGCVKPNREPDAPYRIFGFDDDGWEFDIPCTSFVEAVKAHCDASSGLRTVFISGVSPAVEARLNF